MSYRTSPNPPPPPQLPPGFIAQFDTEYQTYYYVNTATGESSWELPRITVPLSPAASHHSQHHLATAQSPVASHNSKPYPSLQSEHKAEYLAESAEASEAPPPAYEETFGLDRLHLSSNQIATAGAGVAAVTAVGVGAYALHNRTRLPPPPGPLQFYGARHAHVVDWS